MGRKAVKKKQAEPKPMKYDLKADVLYNNRYSLIRLVGLGACSKVCECRDHRNDRNVALKFTSLRVNWQTEKGTCKRVPCISSDKAFLMKILDSFQVDSTFFATVMPFYPTTIYDFTETDGYSLADSQIRVIATQLLSAVKCLHELGVTHTDIKTENLFLVDARTNMFKLADDTFTRRLVDPGIVLGDLDQAVILGKSRCDTQGRLCQTACYRAPEVVLELKWDMKIDEFSCGVLIAELLIGDMPFQPVEEDTDCPTAEERAEHLRQINFQLGPTPRRMFKASPNPKLKHLYMDQFKECKMVDDLPTEWEQIIGRKLYNHLAILATQLMNPDPEFRLSAEEALRMPTIVKKWKKVSSPPISRSQSRILRAPEDPYPLTDEEPMNVEP